MYTFPVWKARPSIFTEERQLAVKQCFSTDHHPQITSYGTVPSLLVVTGMGSEIHVPLMSDDMILGN
uniref:Uncharacterized protein n=1 Tax=Magallana gigas TaxID=29159 RepID=K1RAX3_MAGGI